jgi:DNA-binding transcriptional ArsR family regulator
MAIESSAETVRETVRVKYAERARRVSEESGSCCGTTDCSPITSNLYGSDEVGVIPEDAVKASLGCGNPTALASLAEGEIVLDLGSGGGIDVLLSARRVGPTGFAYGLDMTDEMLALAEKNRVEQGADDPNRVAVDGHIGADPPAPNVVPTTAGLSPSNASHHLACLRDRGLVESRQDWRQLFYHQADGVAELLAVDNRYIERIADRIAASKRPGRPR